MNSNLIAPLGTIDRALPWKGSCPKRPWEYTVTAVIPHLNTPTPLLWAVRTLREQSIKPYILIIDTGSPEDTCRQLESFRDESTEIHYIKSHGWRHSSEPVCAAMDLGFALCRTPLLYSTHADCFARRRDLLEWLSGKCSDRRGCSPVVGYRMSPRDWATTDWQWMVSHTATMYHMPTMHAKGITWSMSRYQATISHELEVASGWIDTEVPFNFALKSAGIRPEFLGFEHNNSRQFDHNIDHVRSYTGIKVYGALTDRITQEEEWMTLAIRQASERVAAWTCQYGSDSVQ